MFDISRRKFLWVSGAAAAGLAVFPLASWSSEADSEGSLKYPFTLPPLPYAVDALEPAIDKETMTIHHTKHHQAYVTNLNQALSMHPELQKKTLTELLRDVEKLPQDIRMAVRNNGGGHVNHSMFWKMMSKTAGKPSPDLAKAIDSSFGDLEKFKAQFSKAAETRFGSGWAWLIAGPDKLEIVSTANQDTPVMDGKTPILGLDVWEHAYYLKYQNQRPKYVKAWWDVVNWQDVSQRYAAALKAG